MGDRDDEALQKLRDLDKLIYGGTEPKRPLRARLVRIEEFDGVAAEIQDADGETVAFCHPNVARQLGYDF